jgi:L-alanine-DL-glutamate epimerase-like enolase superfamily enzyme
MIIESIECHLLSSKYGDGNTLGQPLGVKTIAILELRTKCGISGFGEAYAGIYTPDLVNTITNDIAKKFIGIKIKDILEERNHHFVPFVSRNGLYQSIYGAIEICILDAFAKGEGVPIWKLFSDTPNTDLRFYWSGGSAAFTPEKIADEVKNLNSFYNGYKLRVGHQSWEIDEKRIEAAKNNLGDKHLMIDAIMGSLRPAWQLNDLIEKQVFLKSISPYWLEEPFSPDDYISYRKSANLGIPISFGEALVGKFEFTYFLRTQNLDFMQMDATHMGGINLAKTLIEENAKFIPNLATHTWGSTIAFMANLHMALAFKQFSWIEVPGVELEISKHMGLPNFETISKNIETFSSVPGLGIEVNIIELFKDFEYIEGSGFKI